MARSPENPTLSKLLDSLAVPTAFRKYDDAPPDEKASLDAWAKNAISLLNEVGALLRDLHETYGNGIQLDVLGNVVARVAPFIYHPASLNDSDQQSVYEEERNVLRNESPWIVAASREAAEDILEALEPQKDEKLVKYVLDHVVKPIFRASNPHPHINPATGKSLPPGQIGRAPQQGGVSSITQDFFESGGQRWKDSVGLEAVLYWCIDNIRPNVYDDVWHLVIPPLMTLLDDYQPRYKLWGLLIARRMLVDVPTNLLKRTGIHGLLETSFKKLLAHQDSDLSPTILRLGISQALHLFVLTTPEGSKARFDALCGLLGEGVITTVWTYTFDKPEVVRATLDALPPVIKALDIGCARFLQSIMPQLIHPLVLPSKQGPITRLPSVDVLQLQLQLASVRVLIPLMEVCAPRVQGWRLTILDALVRCWATLPTEHSDEPSPFVFEVLTQPPDSDDEEGAEGYSAPKHQPRKLVVADPQAMRLDDPSSPTDNVGCLKSMLQLAAYQLAQICPSLTVNEYPLLLRTEPLLLKGLLPQLKMPPGAESS